MWRTAILILLTVPFEGNFFVQIQSVYAEVDYQRDVRPILAKACFKCHGPDESQRKSGLRLDTETGFTTPAESGAPAVVPGKIEESELAHRIQSEDPEELMPPPDSKIVLTKEQKKILLDWVAQGAQYRPHWSFQPPQQPPLPAISDPRWPRNAIDYFILAKLDQAGLKPNPEADRYTLIRRVSLDLTGLPPNPEEVEAFVKDTSPEAYEKLVDRLLDSPHYGERWARKWLDLARYADTNGYEKDRSRSIWPYRDWVINALNRDLPFDQFTIEQLAGDMLPNATLSQKIATGFHRNTMLNEEGGIDPLEFRFHAMTDRVHVTSTVWMGLTMACAQCHNHKYDPTTHNDYYQFMAFLNNADEPEIDVPTPEMNQARESIESKIRDLQKQLTPEHFPIEDIEYTNATPTRAKSLAKTEFQFNEDGSVLVSGELAEIDEYELQFETPLEGVTRFQLEVLPDPALPSQGPGRTPHGNFVLTELLLSAQVEGTIESIELKNPKVDFAQEQFSAAAVLDQKDNTGWAIHGPGNWNVRRVFEAEFSKPVSADRWSLRLGQKYGTKHTIGKFRIRLGKEAASNLPLAERSKKAFERAFETWKKQERDRTAKWVRAKPMKASSNVPFLTILDDHSIIASGDQSKRDVYDLEYSSPIERISAIRIEAIPDDQFPKKGPGRVYYEGPFGDFFLSEILLSTGAQIAQFGTTSESFASGGSTAAAAIDGDPQTGWSINGGQGRPHQAVFRLKTPMTLAEGKFTLSMIFEKYYAAGMGRFRVWVTEETKEVVARSWSSEIDQALLDPQGTEDESLKSLYLSIAPEFGSIRNEIEALRRQIPSYPTTLVMSERPTGFDRKTHRHHRGEFLQPKEQVAPAIPGFLTPPASTPRNRLEFARWLVSKDNPLVARVTMNRHWTILFGTGIVRTNEDFGFTGEAPSHPELLDWLATEFMARGWSIKSMHRLIVLSAAYRQTTQTSPEKLSLDPRNRLISRGPRYRLDAEILRDQSLVASGLLSRKLGGASVFPPQPASVTSEGTYGSLEWRTSTGPDRYRRGLYTFAKRTAPYAMFSVFDAPSGESCYPRRELSNTPLQALTVLNDTVFLEVAQHLGKVLALDTKLGVREKISSLFLRILVRPPESEELELLEAFYLKHLARLQKKELDPEKIGGQGPGTTPEQAAWTLTVRALLNTDEALTRE